MGNVRMTAGQTLDAGEKITGDEGAGDLKGVIKDGRGVPVPFANVALFENNVLVTGVSANFDGRYWVRDAPSGRYTVKVSLVGYTGVTESGVLIETDQTTFLDATLVEEGA